MKKSRPFPGRLFSYPQKNCPHWPVWTIFGILFYMKKSEKVRHLCHYCRKKRYEEKMKKLDRWETKAVSQFNNDEKCWACIGCEKPKYY